MVQTAETENVLVKIYFFNFGSSYCCPTRQAGIGGALETTTSTKKNSPKMSDSYAGRTAYTPPMNVMATKVDPMNMLSGTAL